MLKRYQEKRDFSKTPEPQASVKGASKGPLQFVVHKHAARRLHYDLRLEMDGVLKSWAVPAGPSLDPTVKRLAVMVEDHPLDYGSFEGVIPEGEYGAGQVIVWDRGVYAPEDKGQPFSGDTERAQEEMRRQLASGKISITMSGEKMKGSWALVKMQQRGDKNWLLIKHRDQSASDSQDILQQASSVVSGLTVEDLKEQRPPPRDP